MWTTYGCNRLRHMWSSINLSYFSHFEEHSSLACGTTTVCKHMLSYSLRVSCVLIMGSKYIWPANLKITWFFALPQILSLRRGRWHMSTTQACPQWEEDKKFEAPLPLEKGRYNLLAVLPASSIGGSIYRLGWLVGSLNSSLIYECMSAVPNWLTGWLIE